MSETRATTPQEPARHALLARELREQGIELPSAALRARRRSNRAAPLSFAQERLWFLDQLEPGNPVYHISRALRLRGKLDRGALERALDEIIRRHEILRTTFSCVDDKPIQRVAPLVAAAPLLVDLRSIARSQRSVEMRRMLAGLIAPASISSAAH
jgi:hypothetical protein